MVPAVFSSLPLSTWGYTNYCAKHAHSTTPCMYASNIHDLQNHLFKASQQPHFRHSGGKLTQAPISILSYLGGSKQLSFAENQRRPPGIRNKEN